MSFDLVLERSRASFKPGETAQGTIAWDLAQAPTIELRVFWRTEGKGTQDLDVVKVVAVPGGGPRGERSFSLPLPKFPYSYAGKLISIRWFLEAVAQPGGESSAIPLVISPTGADIAPVPAEAPAS
jgi:hypothetical protein